MAGIEVAAIDRDHLPRRSCGCVVNETCDLGFSRAVLSGNQDRGELLRALGDLAFDLPHQRRGDDQFVRIVVPLHETGDDLGAP
jgi:hypothetical protein